MRLRSLGLLGAGYVLGARAGRDRYAQIVETARKASQRVDGYRRNGSAPSPRLADYLRSATSDRPER